MNVKELKEILKDVDDNRIVVLSIDEEGNRFHEVVDYNDQYNYSDGEVGFEKLTPELEKEGYSQEDLMIAGKPALVLWP